MVVRMHTEKGHTTQQVRRVSTLILANFSFSRIQYRLGIGASLVSNLDIDTVLLNSHLL